MGRSSCGGGRCAEEGGVRRWAEEEGEIVSGAIIPCVFVSGASVRVGSYSLSEDVFSVF